MAKKDEEQAARADERVQDQYERWPYPSVPLVARVRPKDAWQAQLEYVLDRCGLDAPPSSRRPSIWIAGCGTFEAYPFAVANPNARILASDLSRRSLSTARRRLWVQGIKHVELTQIDLEDPDAYPHETFDLIVCTGVLMNLRDPVAALRRLRDRLEPRGVLRIMVYPHFSRQRIFWIQRIARALGLRHEIRKAPGRLRRLMHALPTAHPLRTTFDRYRDSRNDAGIVDAFLHAGDRGFTGRELGRLIHDAGLRAASFEHRPWGQPSLQAERLGLDPERPFEILHDLDLWQELRTNFVVACVRQDAPTRRPDPVVAPTSTAIGSTRPVQLRPHPAFTRSGRGPRGRVELWAEYLLGARLPSRTHEANLSVDPADLRALESLARDPVRDPAAAWRLREAGLLLGAHEAAEDRLGPKRPHDDTDLDTAEIDWRAGEVVANPLHGALFAAWRAGMRGLDGSESLVERIDRRCSPIEALEDQRCPFGLTPEGSAHRLPEEAEDLLFDLFDEPGEPSCTPGEIEIVGHDVERELDRVLTRVPGLPAARELEHASQLELWVALCGWNELTLSTRSRTDTGGGRHSTSEPTPAAESTPTP